MPKRFELEGLILFEPQPFRDDRGTFVEFWNAARERNVGFNETFVQDNIAVSKHAVLRGLHFQHPHPQGKLVTVAHGVVYDVVVDVRTGSPTFGKWQGVELDAARGTTLYVPPGFAHGYQVLSLEAAVVYKCTEFYRPDCDRALLWSDASIGIDWPIKD